MYKRNEVSFINLLFSQPNSRSFILSFPLALLFLSLITVNVKNQDLFYSASFHWECFREMRLATIHHHIQDIRIHFTDDAVSQKMSHFGMYEFFRALCLELLTFFEWHWQLLRTNCWDLYVVFGFSMFSCLCKQSMLAYEIIAIKSRPFGMFAVTHT